MDHAAEARGHLASAENDSGTIADDSPVSALAAGVTALTGIGHALLAVEGRLAVIAGALCDDDRLGGQFGELLEKLDGIADEIKISRTDAGERIREELADIKCAVQALR